MVKQSAAKWMALPAVAARLPGQRRWVLPLGAFLLFAGGQGVVQAAIINSGLLVYLDAADSNADNVQGVGSGSTWVNKAGTATNHDGNLYQRGSGCFPTWAGDGSVANPYALQFRPSSNSNGGEVWISNSYAATSELNLQTAFTYEIWVRRNSNGTGYGGSSCLIGHNTNATGQGNGSIDYLTTTTTSFSGIAADSMFSQGGTPVATQLPNSVGDLSTSQFHQIVFARADGSATGSAYYLDGVLQGTFQADSGSSVDADMTIGARSWGTSSTNMSMFLNGDIAIVRVYNASLNESQVVQNFNADGARFGYVVPEPGALGVLAVGLLGLGAGRRRR